MALDLFEKLKKPDEELHPQFLALRDSPGYAPARTELQRLQASFEDVDGNFVEQFQTSGFDARTFELYLFQLFRAAGLAVDRTYSSPDFLVSQADMTVAVEAVTANPTQAQPYQIFDDGSSGTDPIHHARHEAAVRLGSPLVSKLRKKYWELAHVQGRPLVLAIEDFHAAGALMQTATPLIQYLFGTEQRWYHDADGSLVISEHPIESHLKKNLKPIPSGFFSLPDAEMISAVLWTNTGTISKFNRMGQQALGPFRELKMLRAGLVHDLDPNSTVPIPFIYEVGRVDAPIETWRQASALIFNPTARHPIKSDWLGAALEVRRSEAGIVTMAYEPFIPHSSMTSIYSAETPRSVLREHREKLERLMASAVEDAMPALRSLGMRPL